ncbi:raftlin-2-like isoform X2 [Paramormyrops kingsleyae]|nr:raftlin-2-like isoform X2 [Paramormyrops kingsleyae]XP_023684757.1 raftlin-2-like isoform X2 [Paramormyrops kingsleyae]
MLAALHPIILSVGRSRTLPCSLLYRAVLARLRSSKQAVTLDRSVPVLRAEMWPLPGDSLTEDTVRALIDRVNSSAQSGVRFVGSVLQHVRSDILRSNGRMPSPRRSCRSPPRTPPCTPPQVRDQEESVYSPDLQLLVFFHSWAPGCAPLDALACSYHQGALSMRVSRKGQVISALEADWLELTAAYYRKGWSLVDSFVYWDIPKGEPVPRSLEGLFVYEERSSSPPANDTIVVEQWTVIEGANVKTDYGPLLHTLAEFGWQLTCVLPTPIIRHDSDGNLATKQVVFLQRPVRARSTQHRTQAGSPQTEAPSLSVDPNDQSFCTAGTGVFPVFGGGYPSVLSQLDDGGFEPDEGVAEVTCM